MTDEEILSIWEDTYVQRGDTGLEFAKEIERRTIERCADLVLRTDLSQLPKEWQGVASHYLVTYADAIRGLK